jgi:hypothetical protein
MIDTHVLDIAMRRFPYRLQRWRSEGLGLGLPMSQRAYNELCELLPTIILEYRLVLKEREHATRIASA